MKKNEKIRFAVDNVELIKENPDSRFALMSMDFFASGTNLHSLFVSEDTLLRTSPSIRNCPIVWEYDAYRDDIGTHSIDEVACGFVPESSKVSSRILPDGRTMLSVIAYVWKNYSGQILDFFKRDEGKKPISVEMSVYDIQKTENGDELLDYRFEAITILGSDVTPAIPMAKSEIVRFSKEYEKDFKAEFSKKTNGAQKENDDMTDKIKEQEKENLEEIAFEEPVDEVVTEEVVDEPVSEVVDEQVIEEDFSEEEDEVETEEPEEVEDQEDVKEDEMSDNIEFSLNSAQITEILRKKLSEYSYEDEYGKWARYWVRAYDEKFVYIYDFEEDETYRAPYKIEGGEVSISLEEKEEVISGGYKTVAEYEQSFSISKEMTEAILTVFKDYDKYAVLEEELSKEEKNYENIFAIFNERIVKMSEDRNMYLSKNEELQKFKDDIEEKDFSNDVKVFLKDIEEKVVISEEQLGDMKNKSFDFKENIDEWKTMCKAEVFELPKRDVEGQEKIFAIPWNTNPKNEKKPLWKKK